MPKKRKKSFKDRLNNFFTLLIIAGLICLGLWIKSNQQKIKNQYSKPLNPQTESKPESAESKPESIPTSQPTETQQTVAKSFIDLFPKEAWPDDYLKIEAPLGDSKEKLLLVSIGIAPAGISPEKIHNPEKLRPALLVMQKEGNEFKKLNFFNFATPQATEAGIQSTVLRGLPRITSSRLVDLDGDGKPEIMVSLDTAGGGPVAIGFLKWNKDHLEWIKTRDRFGVEKISLWLSGTAAEESQEIITSDMNGDGRFEIVQKTGHADPKHLEQGFVWKTTLWEMKDGVLQTKP